MRNLEVSGWMTKPDLSIIEVKKDDKNAPATTSASRTLPYSFSLKVQLANPNATQEGGVPLTGGPAIEGAPAAEAAPETGAAPATPQSAPAPATPAAPADTAQPQPAAQNEGRPAS